jgi:hypothetical protein
MGSSIWNGLAYLTCDPGRAGQAWSAVTGRDRAPRQIIHRCSNILLPLPRVPTLCDLMSWLVSAAVQPAMEYFLQVSILPRLFSDTMAEHRVASEPMPSPSYCILPFRLPIQPAAPLNLLHRRHKPATALVRVVFLNRKALSCRVQQAIGKLECSLFQSASYGFASMKYVSYATQVDFQRGYRVGSFVGHVVNGQ